MRVSSFLFCKKMETLPWKCKPKVLSFSKLIMAYFYQSGISQYIRTSLTSRNSRFNQWERLFWLKCWVSQQTKGFKMADKEGRECFPMPWMRVVRRYTLISNWVKYCRNYEIKGKFAFAFHVTDNSARITINLGPKEALTTERNLNMRTAGRVWRATVIILGKRP